MRSTTELPQIAHLKGCVGMNGSREGADFQIMDSASTDVLEWCTACFESTGPLQLFCAEGWVCCPSKGRAPCMLLVAIGFFPLYAYISLMVLAYIWMHLISVNLGLQRAQGKLSWSLSWGCAAKYKASRTCLGQCVSCVSLYTEQKGIGVSQCLLWSMPGPSANRSGQLIVFV